MTKDQQLSQFYDRMLDKNHALLPECDIIEDLICRVLYGSYYNTYGKTLSRSVAQKYYNNFGSTPKSLQQYYTGDNALNATMRDLGHVTGICVSTYRLHLMQERVHSWLPESGLSEDIVDQLNCYYISVGATRDQVAYFLAHVRHQLMVA